MKIGELARRTGASVKALRLYETQGLLPPVQRVGRYRYYTQRHVDQVTLIKQAQQLGFRLRELTPLKNHGNGVSWPLLRALMEEKRAAIRVSIAELQRQDAELTAHIDELRGCPEASGSVDDCAG